MTYTIQFTSEEMFLLRQRLLPSGSSAWGKIESAQPDPPATSKRDQWVLVSGNPFDGLNLHGPFTSPEGANEYGRNHWGTDTWWSASMAPPDLDGPEEPDMHSTEPYVAG